MITQLKDQSAEYELSLQSGINGNDEDVASKTSLPKTISFDLEGEVVTLSQGQYEKMKMEIDTWKEKFYKLKGKVEECKQLATEIEETD